MTIHLSVEKARGEEVLRELRKKGLVDYAFDITSMGGRIFIPIPDNHVAIPEHLGQLCDIEGRPRRMKPRPEGIKGSYDVIGSIVIMKRSTVRDPLKLAGNLLMRPGIETVFLDDGVQGENRTRTLTLLAGEDVRTTLYRENGIVLKVDVEKAYFSPRLATERMLVSKSVRDGERIVDMFAGIGPFSVLIARNHGCDIVSIDHNESAVSLMKENISLNRLKGKITPVLGDAGLEIRRHEELDRVIMNLPHGAFPFIADAVKSLKKNGRINFYEVSSVEAIVERMKLFREMGLSLISKREVHGYSKGEFMYSMELSKI